MNEMTLGGASGLYLLNLSVDRVVLINETSVKRKLVCLQAFFWGLPMINIYQVRNGNENNGGEQNVFANFELGTTGYFHSQTIDLIRSIQRHPILITVFQILEGADTLESVGTCRVKVTEKFSELISRAATCAVKHAVSGVVKGVYNIMNKEHIQVGTLTVHIQLVCYDNSLLKAPYVFPSEQNHSLVNVGRSKYLLPRKTSYGFALVPAEEEEPNAFTESFPNGKGFFNRQDERQRNNLAPQTSSKSGAALFPIDITGLVCDTTISESFFEQSNDSFISQRKGESKNERRNEYSDHASYTVEQPRGKPGGGVSTYFEGTGPHDEHSGDRKMTIVTYRSDSGTDNSKRQTTPNAGGKVTDSATRIHSAHEQPKQLTPVRLYCKEGSVEGSRQSSVIASPALESSQATIGKQHSCEEKDLYAKASPSKKTSNQAGQRNSREDLYLEKGEYSRKSTGEYVMMAFAPRPGLKKSSCDPLNYEYSKASQRICEKYLKRRQEKANYTTSPKFSEKHPYSQHLASETSFEQLGAPVSPISSVFNNPFPDEAIHMSEYSCLKHLCNSAQQSNSAHKASEKHSQVERTLAPSVSQPPYEISHEDVARYPRNPRAETAASKTTLKQSFTRENRVQEALQTPNSRSPQPEMPTPKIPTPSPCQPPKDMFREVKCVEWQYPQEEETISNRPSGQQSPLGRSREATDLSRKTSFSDGATRRSPYQQSDQRSLKQSPLLNQRGASAEAIEKLCSQSPYAEQTGSPSRVLSSEYQNVERRPLQYQKAEKIISKPSSGRQSPSLQFREPVSTEKQPSHYPFVEKTTPETAMQYRPRREMNQDQALELDHSQYPLSENKVSSQKTFPQYQSSAKISSDEKNGGARSYAAITPPKAPSRASQHQVADNIERASQHTDKGTPQQISQYETSCICPGKAKEVQSLEYPVNRQSTGAMHQNDEVLTKQVPVSDYLFTENTASARPFGYGGVPEKDALGPHLSYQSSKAVQKATQRDLQNQVGPKAGEEFSPYRYQSERQNLPEESGREFPVRSYSDKNPNYSNASKKHYGFGVDPDSLSRHSGTKSIGRTVETIPADTCRLPNGVWSGPEYRALDLQYGAGPEERQSAHPYRESADKRQNLSSQFHNEPKDNFQTAAEKLPSTYGNQTDNLRSQCQPETAYEENLECDSILTESCCDDEKPQGMCRVPVDLEDRGREGSGRGPEFTPQNAYGGMKRSAEEASSSRYQPACCKNTSDRELTCAHLCCPFRPIEREDDCQRDNDKTMESKTQPLFPPSSCDAFRSYQDGGCSSYQGASKPRGHTYVKHFHDRKSVKHAMKQPEYSQYRDEFCDSTEKPEADFGEYGSAHNTPAKPFHVSHASVDTAKEEQQSQSGFSQYQTVGKELYAEAAAAVWDGKTDYVDQATDNNLPDVFFVPKENLKEDNHGWNDYSDIPRCQIAGYANNICPNDDTTGNGVRPSDRIETPCRKSKQHQQLFRKFSGHLSNPRDNRTYCEETPSARITPILSSGSLKGRCQPSQWDSTYSVTQNTSNVSPVNNGTPGWAFHRTSSETEVKTGNTSPYSVRPTTAPACNAPNFLKNRGGLQNAGYSHCGGHTYYHDYRDVNIPRYNSYGGQSFLNACGADGCLNRMKTKLCWWSIFLMGKGDGDTCSADTPDAVQSFWVCQK